MRELLACDAIDFLGGEHLFLNKDALDWILNHIDFFVSQSRGNESIEELNLDPYVSFDRQDVGFWDKVGQAVGNLQALKIIHIFTYDLRDHDGHGDSDTEDEDENQPTTNAAWAIQARILSHVRQKVSIRIGSSYVWDAKDSIWFARAIRGHPTITSFHSCFTFPYESLDTLHSALATLPALEDIMLSCGLHTRSEDELALANPESLTDLLRVPTLRFVDFSRYFFTPALCQATVNAFLEGMAVTRLNFIKCKFSTEESTAIMANGLSRNTSVTYIVVVSPWDGTLYNALAMALPLNSTLQELYLIDLPSNAAVHVDLSPIFLKLGNNSGLKLLLVGAFGSMDESLCTAMQNGLGMNETLESLVLNHVPLCVDNTDLMCRAFSFLRTNNALKSLTIGLKPGTEPSCGPAFRINVAANLEDNTSLESLYIQSWNTTRIKAEEYLLFLTAFQRNKTLKTLSIYGNKRSLTLTEDEDKQMAALLQKNYAMESLPEIIDLEHRPGDVSAILRLNKAGRRYLIEDGSSISKGIKVLSAVRSDINCVFLHLLENPRLCDRNAVEAAASDDSDSTDNGGSTSPENHTIGKREHGRAQNGGTEGK